MKRRATAVWNGTVLEGSGDLTLSITSSALSLTATVPGISREVLMRRLLLPKRTAR